MNTGLQICIDCGFVVEKPEDYHEIMRSKQGCPDCGGKDFDTDLEIFPNEFVRRRFK